MKTIQMGEINLAYEIFGEENNNIIVLISGLGNSMIRWDISFCRLLVENGFRVIRFDNRDSGSSVFTTQKDLPSGKDIEKIFVDLRRDEIPYSLMDMAKDVIRLLDYLQIEKTHIVGRSMGGIIAQLSAYYFPERVKTLTMIMSTSLNPSLPPPDSEVMQMMTTPGTDPAVDKEQYIRERINFAEKISGNTYTLDPTEEKALVEEELHRSKTKNGIIRQLLAMGSYEYNEEILKRIVAPTLVIHGTDDLIFHPDCGKDIADSIPEASFVLVEGMGHSIPKELYMLIGTCIMNLAS
nr:alpha/beta hydrolase [uncultured Chryseobacterium sp.]